MDLSFTSDEEQLRQKVRKFLAEEIPKSGLTLDRFVSFLPPAGFSTPL